MNDTKLQVHADLSAPCIEFLRHKLDRFDTRELEYFRLYDRTGQTTTHGVWGRCTFPNRKKQLGYRIRCCVSIRVSQFPYPAKWAVGTRQLGHGRWEWVWREDRFRTKEEALVWLAGHEAFHWLRHSRQIPGANYETQANRYGFAWLDEWRALTTEGHGGVFHLETVGKLPITSVDTTKARLYYENGRITHWEDQRLAYAVWLGLPKGVRVAFRGANDTTPVYPWECVDAL